MRPPVSHPLTSERSCRRLPHISQHPYKYLTPLPESIITAHVPHNMSSSPRIPQSGPSNSTLTYPPAAKVKHDSQPTPKAEMSLRPAREETRAERLRGGCIPCPVGFITGNSFVRSVGRSFTDTAPVDRTADAVFASLFPAVDHKR